MKEYIVAFLVARLSSSRLPKKHLRKIGDKRLIDWTIENVKKSNYVDKIVIATTNEKENMLLKDIAIEHNVDIFLYDGDIDDVVGRLTKAAITYEADIPILISGDCPLIWSESLDRLIENILKDKSLDCINFCLKNDKHPIHEGMSVYRKKAWVLADKLSKSPALREHQFPIIGIEKDKFKVGCVEDDELFYKIKHRISIDTLADLKFMNTIYDNLNDLNLEFNLKNAVELLIKKPYLLDINRDVHQMKLYEKQKKALFVVKKEDNLELFFDLAYDLTKKGVGVRFYSKEEALLLKIQDNGFGVISKINNKHFDFRITEEE